MLPALIEALVQGLRRGRDGEEERDAFLSTLVDCHAHAMKVGCAESRRSPTRRRIGRSDRLQRETFAVGEQRVEEVRLAGTAEGAARAAAAAVPRLHPGSWIELERGARAAARKRLAWVSPVTGLFLFVGVSPGSMAIAISPAALAELQRRGRRAPSTPRRSSTACSRCCSRASPPPREPALPYG
jgi:hypothetical protein